MAGSFIADSTHTFKGLAANAQYILLYGIVIGDNATVKNRGSTGDVGYMDEDGYIFITGRKKSVIVLENGKNVFPEEVEEYLANIPCIAESVVVGRKKDDSDTIVLTAIVYPAYSEFPAGTDSATISSTIKDEIAKMNRTIVSYKQIRAIEIRSTEFEKTTSKKIKRHLVS